MITPNRRVVLLLHIFLTLPHRTFGADEPSQQIARAKAAILRTVCFDYYWTGTGRIYELGHDKVLKLRFLDNGTFLGRIVAIGRIGQHSTDANFLGLDRGSAATVTGNYSQDFDQQLHSASTFEIALRLPTSCGLQDSVLHKKSLLVLPAVVDSIVNALRRWRQHSSARLPSTVTLKIPAFDPDQWAVYVAAEPIHQVYAVVLHNPNNYEDPSYSGSEMIVMPVQDPNQVAELTKKIANHLIYEDTVDLES